MKIFLVLASMLLFVSCSTSIPETQLTFHTQTPPGESQSMVMEHLHRGKKMRLRQLPSFSLKDIETYQPFVAKNGTYGAIFNLTDIAKRRLFHHTVENQGYYMVSIFNGDVSEAIKIDRPINDGKLLVWENLTPEDISQLDYSISRADDSPEEASARTKTAKKKLKEYYRKAKKSD